MPADLAFAHCWAVLDDTAAANDAAIAALRRAGRSRSSILGHARYQALLAPEPSAPDPETAAPDDLVELARLLGLTKPARERGVIDLRARLDRADFGRALGSGAADAAVVADTVAEGWDRDLDPQLLVKLGPGDCPELAGLLADLDHTTLGALAAAGPTVAAHVDGCEVCTDRRRAMVSVRTLFTQTEPPPTPSAVRDVARRARRMRPAAPPPPFEPRRRSRALVAVAITAVVVLAVGVVAVVLSRPNSGRARRVNALVRVPTGRTRLAVASIGDAVEITNRSAQPLRWQAKADAPWLELQPASGTLAGGARTSVRARALPSSPEGAIKATITVTGADGSAAATTWSTHVERAPDLAAFTDTCTVNATIEDSSGVGTATLYWTDQAGKHAAALTLDGAVYRGSLPESDPLTWWVVAVDKRGNQARTPDVALSC